MGKVPIRMKAVVYSLSPFQQKVMPGLWKDLPGKIHHKVSENWLNTILLVGPVLGTYMYVQNYKEKEKLEHRLLGGSDTPTFIPGLVFMSEKGQPLPKFGEWDVNDPASAEGFTVIFNKARNEKKTGGTSDSPEKDDGLKQRTDPGKYQAVNNRSNSKKKWFCCGQPTFAES